jgi:hypothetical protein
MREVKDPVALRPLGFGEIFDRAITLYLKNFLPFVGIALIALVPFAFIEYAMGSSQSSVLTQLLGQLSHPTSTAPLPTGTASFVGLIFLGGLLALLIQPLVYGAIAFGVERLYKGETVAFRPCMGASWAHWPRIMGLVGLAVASAIAAYLVLVIAVVAVVLIGLATHGMLALVVLGVVGFVALFIGIIWLFVAWTFALYAIVVEDIGVIEAIGSGFRRVFNRKELWRALGLAVCSTIIAFVAQLLLAVVALLAGHFGAMWLQSAIQALSSLLVVPFSVIVLAIYYFDVRVRREGLDFQRRLGLTLREE